MTVAKKKGREKRLCWSSPPFPAVLLVASLSA